MADLTVHGASSGNPHAHIMLTTREIGPEGFGKKNHGWGRKQTLRQWRSEWERYANAALEMARHAVRIDHRSLEAQGIERKPGVHLGPRVAAMERRGIETAREGQWREAEPGLDEKTGERETRDNCDGEAPERERGRSTRRGPTRARGQKKRP